MSRSAEEDRRLLSGCLTGDRRASELFVRRFSGLIYHSVRHILTTKHIPFSNEDLEDHHNTIFLLLFENGCRKLSQYQGKNGCSLASWLRVVAVRTVLNYERDRGINGALRQDGQTPLENLSEEHGESPGPLALLEEVEQRRLLQETIPLLSPRERLFIKLHMEQGLPMEETASALGISIQNAYTVKHRAIKRLKAYLIPYKKNSIRGVRKTPGPCL